MRTSADIQDAISKLSETEQRELFHRLGIHLGNQEIVEQVLRLTQCYEIWWKIENFKNVKRNGEVLKEYLDFFEPVAHILLWQGFFVICHQLFDQNPKSKHIQSRINQIPRTNARLADEMRKKINDYDVLNKIKTIRHNISAHRDRNRNPQQVVKDVGLVVKELKEVLTFVQDIVSTLVEALGGEKKSAVMQKISACQTSARNSAFQVMEALAKSLRDASEAGFMLGDEKVEPRLIREKRDLQTKPRIVLVNDEAEMLQIIESLISDRFTVLKFQSGEQAWQELQRQDPDILVTDMQRPNDSIDGWTMIPLLADKKVKYPVVIVSSCREFSAEDIPALEIFGAEAAKFNSLLQYARQTLNITTVATPFDSAEFLKLLEAQL
jgi:CheY-like chemotaxis protein